MSNMFKWTVEISVDEVWIKEGFNFDNYRIEDMLDGILPYAYHSERSARIIQAPDPKEIEKVKDNG